MTLANQHDPLCPPGIKPPTPCVICQIITTARREERQKLATLVEYVKTFEVES